MTYLEKLNDPKWHTKAKKIIQRDDFKCTVCGNKNKLQVHHTFYYNDFPDPWTYPNDSLLTLCRKCHKSFHEINEVEIRPKAKINRIKKIGHLKIKKHRKSKIKNKRKIICLAEMQVIRGIKIKERKIR